MATGGKKRGVFLPLTGKGKISRQKGGKEAWVERAKARKKEKSYVFTEGGGQ